MNGEGFGANRKLTRGVQAHPRRSLDLWNRDNNAVSAFFWDGHVEVLDSKRRIFRSPLGTSLPRGFQNAMAVQSIFPLTVPDEMLGAYGDRSNSTLPEAHARKVNDLVIAASYESDAARMTSILQQLMKRLLAFDEAAAPWQRIYQGMFERAYPAKPLREMSIVDLGNAIAHFEELAFAADDSPWDRYVAGDQSAISREAKLGAILFYGKARCAACHSGLLFSDFSYHGIGVFSKINVNGSPVNDYGRGGVTGRPEDRYAFRTPPLRNVTKRSPYFHDGSTAGIYNAMVRHLDPLAKAGSYLPDGDFALHRDQIDSISPILVPEIRLSPTQLRSVITFLTTLESQSRDVDQIVPKRVPSGIPVNYTTEPISKRTRTDYGEALAVSGPPAVAVVHTPRADLLLEVARTEAQRRQGLMDRARIQAHTGMIFVFGRDRRVEFWMKDTPLSLDMVFVGSDGTVRRVYANVLAVPASMPDTAIPRESGVAKYVIELPAGEAAEDGIAARTKLDLHGIE